MHADPRPLEIFALVRALRLSSISLLMAPDSRLPVKT